MSSTFAYIPPLVRTDRSNPPQTALFDHLTAKTSSSQDSSTLLKLPTEILSSILFLCPTESRDNLAATCSLCYLRAAKLCPRHAAQTATSGDYEDRGKAILVSADDPKAEEWESRMRACLAWTYVLDLTDTPDESRRELPIDQVGWFSLGKGSMTSLKPSAQDWRIAPNVNAVHVIVKQNPGAREESSWSSGMCPDIQILRAITDALPYELPVVSTTGTEGAFDGFYMAFLSLVDLKVVPDSTSGSLHRVHTLLNRETPGTSLKDTSQRSWQRETSHLGGIRQVVTEFDRGDASTFKYANSGERSPSEQRAMLVRNIGMVTITAGNQGVHHVVIPECLDRAALGLDASLTEKEVMELLEEEVRAEIPRMLRKDAEADYHMIPHPPSQISLSFMSRGDADACSYSAKLWGLGGTD